MLKYQKASFSSFYLKGSLERLKEFYEKYKDKELAVTTHKNADTDAIVSAILIKVMFPKAKLYIQDIMNYPAQYLLKWVKKAFNLVFEFKKLQESKEELLIVVDTSGNANCFNKKVIGIFDHHEPKGTNIKGEYEFKNSKAPANALLVWEALILLESEGLLKVPKWVHTVSAIALISDTARFERGDPGTFISMASLLELSGRPYGELRQVAFPHPSRESLEWLIEALGDALLIESIPEKVEARKRYIIVKNGTPLGLLTKIPENSSVRAGDISSNLKQLTNLPIVVVYRKLETEWRISVRTSNPPYDAVTFLNDYLKCEQTKCGGHPGAAGGSFSLEIPEEELVKRIVEGIKNYIKIEEL